MRPREPGERSLGFLEVGSLSRGVVCADAMVKTAAVRLSLLSPVSGGRMLVAIDGAVAPVESALARGIETAASDLRDALFLPDLHPDVPLALALTDRREVGESLGMVETATVAAAIRAADAARKAAEIRLVRLRLAFGIAGKGFLQITGLVAAVEAGVAAAAQAVDFPEFLLRTDVIPSVHADLRRWLGRELRHDGLPFDPIPGE